MKRYRFCILTILAAMSVVASGCEPLPPAGPPQPFAVHQSPAPRAIDLTPTRNGQVIELPPGHEAGAYDASASPVLGPTTTVRVGLLLPLTGRSAELGRAMQDAATISLFDKYARLSTAQQQVRVELLPKDTGDTPEQAQAAMKAAVDDGAQLIIGPIFSNATEAVVPLARAKDISVISLSNNRNQASPGIYAFGFSPGEQASRVVKFAAKAGKTRIATLLPDSALGDVVSRAAREAATSSNFALVAEARYAAEGVGLESAIEKILPSGSGAPPFDALLLVESGPTLSTILRALGSRGVNPSNVQLLGTGMWDDASLLQQTSLEGAWLASSPPQSTAQFEQRFLSTYKYTPPRIASLAYDAVALAVTLATSQRPYNQPNLTQSAGYAGPANGIFRLRLDGGVERALAVLRVNGTQLTVIDPAPAEFTTSTAH
jgi:ABC-type branched-subunit amino acid transport system substrate-binding protein